MPTSVRPALIASAALTGLFGPLVFRLCRFIDARFARTDREREALQLLAEGKSTKEIADALRVSVKTVETHRRNIMEKLNLHSVAELTKYAIREGITSVDA